MTFMKPRPFLTLLTLLSTALLSFGGEVQRLDDIPYLEPGRTETLDLYLPPATSEAPRPAVLWIHGGGWQGGTKRNRPVEECCRDLAEAGYIVASIDYALATNERHTWPLAVLDGNHETIPAAGRGKVSGLLLNFEVEDVDGVYAELRAAGLPILREIRDEDFGQRHFITADPNGVLIDVITPIPPSADYAALYDASALPR